MTSPMGRRANGPRHGNQPPSRNPALRRPQERGAGTVLALGLGLVVILSGALLLLLAQSAVAASRAAAAADLAALAGADAARGITPGQPCAVAREAALKNNATMLTCSQGPDASVQVRTEIGAGPFLGVARGLARAGPPPGPENGPAP